MASHRQLIGLAFAAIYIFWGGTYYALALAMEHVGPMTLAALRFLLAGSIVFGWAWLRGGRVGRGAFGSAVVPGVLFFTCGNGAVSWAESRGLPTSTTAMLVASMPLWVALLNHLVGEEERTLSWSQRVGLVVGFFGTAVLVGATPEGADPIATAVVASGAVAWAAGSVIVARRTRLRSVPVQDSIAQAGLQMLSGGLGCVLISLAAGERTPELAQLDGPFFAAFAYLVLLGSVVGFLAYAYLLRNVPAPRVATYAYVNPIVAVSIGVAMGESLSAAASLAMTFVVVAVVITVAPRR